MANIVITTSGNSIIVTFNNYSSVVNADKKSYNKSDIVEVILNESSANVSVLMRDANGVRVWELTYDSTYSGSEFFIVDTVSGVSPTSESDLFDKITALRG